MVKKTANAHTDADIIHGDNERINAPPSLIDLFKSSLRVMKPLALSGILLLNPGTFAASSHADLISTNATTANLQMIERASNPEFVSNTIQSRSTRTQNWAGYIASNGINDPKAGVTYVAGTWEVPVLWNQCGWQDTYHPARYSFAWSSQWIGIGGHFKGDHSLIQIGVQSNFYFGKKSYTLFYQTRGDKGRSIDVNDFHIKPKDIVHAQIQLLDNKKNTWKLSMENLTEKTKPFSIIINYDSKRLSAEWIEERPIGQIFGQWYQTPLPGFNAIRFLDLSTKDSNYATIGKVSGGISKFDVERVTLWEVEDGTNIAHESAIPSKISPNGRAFSIYKLDCSLPDPKEVVVPYKNKS